MEAMIHSTVQFESAPQCVLDFLYYKEKDKMLFFLKEDNY